MAEPAAKPVNMPPYIAFKTLTDIVERMEREDPPTRVDPTYLDTYAGGYRPTVIGNLQTMGLLAKTGEPTAILLALVKADEPTRKKLIGELLHTVYPDVLALPKNSTQGQFLEVFSNRGAQGDTRRKAISFFLKAASYAGVPTGTHWKTPPAGTAGAGRRRAKGINGGSDAAKTDLSANGVVDGSSPDGWAEIVHADFGDAGRVVVNVGVKWLQLDDDTFVALRRAISDIKVLAAAADAAASHDGADDGDTGEDSS